MVFLFIFISIDCIEWQIGVSWYYFFELSSSLISIVVHSRRSVRLIEVVTITWSEKKTQKQYYMQNTFDFITIIAREKKSMTEENEKTSRKKFALYSKPAFGCFDIKIFFDYFFFVRFALVGTRMMKLVFG